MVIVKNKEQNVKLVKAFNKVDSLENHLKTLIEAQIVTMSNGKKHITDLGKILQEALKRLIDTN